jgi:predicted protein tyrosine phosphatase
MKVFAISRADANRLKDRASEFNIISINDPCDPYLFPAREYPHVLSLMFHDTTNEKSGLVVFTEEMAEDVKSYLDNNIDPKKNLIVHCFAGICRSGAVATFANEYLYDKGFITDDEREQFSLNNPTIHPNSLVLALLNREKWEKRFSG